jgi:DNA-binding transcriptional regulator LsrR (DeoR family)
MPTVTKPSADDLRLLVKVSRFYYEDGLNQDAIKDRLGLSRSKVSRLMAQARDLGVVQISVLSPESLHLGLESRLEERFGLQEAFVVEAQPVDSQAAVSRAVGQGAAAFLVRALEPRSRVGFAWGSTLRYMAAALPTRRFPEVELVQIIGGLGEPAAEVHATELCRSVSRSLGCQLTLLPVPGIVADQRTRRALLSDVHVQRAMETFEELDLAVVGVGAPTLDSVTMRDGSIISRAELERLLARGAVGDIALRYFDVDGRTIRSEIDDRIIGITLAQLRKGPRVVAVSGGPQKVDAIRAALRGRLIDVLVTDSLTAAKLLEPADG